MRVLLKSFLGLLLMFAAGMWVWREWQQDQLLAFGLGALFSLMLCYLLLFRLAPLLWGP